MEPLRGDEVSRWVAAPPAVLYALVSDVTRTPQWSPEVIECRWLDETWAGQPGARFRARNKRRWFVWSNTPTVEIVESPRAFAFTRTEPGGGSIRWSYEFAPERGGTMSTHRFEVLRPVPAGLQWFLRVVFGVRDLQADLHANMTASLARLAEIATHDQASTPGATR